jgi:hypothetical protein
VLTRNHGVSQGVPGAEQKQLQSAVAGQVAGVLRLCWNGAAGNVVLVTYLAAD